MKKKLIVAVATSLILSSGSSIALASGGSGDSSTTSTTVPASPRLTDAQRAALLVQNEARNKYLVDLAKYKRSYEMIGREFTISVVNARRISIVALNSATTLRDRVLAQRAFQNAFITATKKRDAALRALGAPPVKP